MCLARRLDLSKRRWHSGQACLFCCGGGCVPRLWVEALVGRGFLFFGEGVGGGEAVVSGRGYLAGPGESGGVAPGDGGGEGSAGGEVGAWVDGFVRSFQYSARSWIVMALVVVIG